MPDARHPLKAIWHHVLALGPHPFPSLHSWKSPSDGKHPKFFFHHSKLQLSLPLLFLHIPQLSRPSLYSLLHQPYAHLFFLPFPMSLLGTSLLSLISKPINLVSSSPRPEQASLGGLSQRKRAEETQQGSWPSRSTALVKICLPIPLA